MLLISFREPHCGERVLTIGTAQAMGLDLIWMFMKVWLMGSPYTILVHLIVYLYDCPEMSCSFLAFEPGPHLISFRPSARNVPLQASMTVTDGQWISYFNIALSDCFNYLLLMSNLYCTPMLIFLKSFREFIIAYDLSM